MAQIKSEKKDILTNEKNNQRNAAYKSRVRTAIKKVESDVEKKDAEKAEADLKIALGLIDRSLGLGIQKQNTVNRQKAHVYAAYNKLKAAPKAEEKPAAVAASK